MADRNEDGVQGAHLSVLNDSNLYESSQMPLDSGNSAESYSEAQEGNGYRQSELSPKVKECSMCGDVGISKVLFQCQKCRNRYQHIYCSRSYPKLRREILICNWCLHEDDKIQRDQQMKQLSRSEENIGIDKTTAFQFLLQIAQSLPENCSSGETFQPAPAVLNDSEITSSDQVRKRQRCNHAREKSRVLGMDRWRPLEKNKVQMNPSKGIGRRYKLLADVMC